MIGYKAVIQLPVRIPTGWSKAQALAYIQVQLQDSLVKVVDE